jgi:hypothetical protein
VKAVSRGDTSAIQRLIGRARFRIRSQWALEGATTATVLAAAAALAAVFAIRAELVTFGTGLILLIGAGAIVVAGAIIGAVRPLDDERVARRIDRASNLADRLSTAIAFHRTFAATPGAVTDAETSDLMEAAIRDGARAVPRANIAAAAPFRMPRDWRAAAGFLAVSALAAGLALPTIDRDARLFRADPDHGTPGSDVVLIGEHLLAGPATATTAEAPASAKPYVPTEASVYMGTSQNPAGRPVVLVDWSRTQIKVRIPLDAPVGDTLLTAYLGEKQIGPVAFTVVDPKDTRFHSADAVMLDPDEHAYVEAIIGELIRVARRDNVPELEDFAKKLLQLLKDAEEGKVTKEKLLEALKEAEAALNAKAEPDQKEVDKQLSELGKDLKQSELTKELGKALEKNDLDKAKEELEKLAAKLDPKELEQQKKDLEEKLKDQSLSEQEKKDLQKKLAELKQQKPMTEKEKDQLAKQLQKAADKMEQQKKDQQQKAQQMQKKLEEEIRRLQKERDQAKNEKERLDAERRLEKKRDELKQLQKNQDEKEQSAQREAIKRLQKDIEQAAESLQKPKSKEESQQEQEARERQASQKLKDAARDTQRVDQDKRKQTAQRKLASQMEDLKEAMQRAKQKGNKGPQNPFDKQSKNQDFAQRARGQKGNGQGWKPSQGQGQGQAGGQGQQPGGSTWGVGHDPNLTADATDKTGNTKEQDLQGKAGKNGSSRRETILAAAQKGFASRQYKDVYTKYHDIVEDVMRNEKLPSSYKYYVKRYFAKIHPTGDTELDTPSKEDK